MSRSFAPQAQEVENETLVFQCQDSDASTYYNRPDLTRLFSVQDFSGDVNFTSVIFQNHTVYTYSSSRKAWILAHRPSTFKQIRLDKPTPTPTDKQIVSSEVIIVASTTRGLVMPRTQTSFSFPVHILSTPVTYSMITHFESPTSWIEFDNSIESDNNGGGNGNDNIGNNNGSDDIGSNNGNVNVSSSNGNVNVSSNNGNVNVSSNNGNVNIGNNNGNDNIGSNKGNVNIGNNNGNDNIGSNNGNVNIGNNNGNGNIGNNNGNVNIGYNNGNGNANGDGTITVSGPGSPNPVKVIVPAVIAALLGVLLLILLGCIVVRRWRKRISKIRPATTEAEMIGGWDARPVRTNVGHDQAPNRQYLDSKQPTPLNFTTSTSVSTSSEPASTSRAPMVNSQLELRINQGEPGTGSEQSNGAIFGSSEEFIGSRADMHRGVARSLERNRPAQWQQGWNSRSHPHVQSTSSQETAPPEYHE